MDHPIGTDLLEYAVRGLREKSDAPMGSIPNDLRTAFSLFSLHMVATGHPSRGNWNEFVELLYAPLFEWKLLGMPEELLNRTVLTPSGELDDWTDEIHSTGAVSSNRDERLMPEALQTCRQQGDQDAYTAFRRFLVENPVIEENHLAREMNSTQLRPLRDLLKNCYESVPSTCQFSNGSTALLCGYCGWTLRSDGERLHCSSDICRTRTHGFKHIREVQLSGLRRLKRGLAGYVCRPGKAELSLASQLERMGLEVTLYPHFDAFDLLVCKGKMRLAIDVKDVHSPTLLAHDIAPIPASEEWTEGWFVVPDDQVRATRGYLDIVRRRAGTLLGDRTRIATVKTLVKHIESVTS